MPRKVLLRIPLLAFALGLALASAWSGWAQPSESTRPGKLDFPSAFTKGEFQSLLQRFVSEQYQKSFRRLGEETDFDHGHLLFEARSSRRPVAILYHTQELSQDLTLNPQARNWIQWVDRGTVENADRYERRTYPRSGAWDWFQRKDLPALRMRHTILAKMLDPDLLGAEVSQSWQWVFSRVECAPLQTSPESDVVRIALPAGPTVCLVLHQD